MKKSIIDHIAHACLMSTQVRTILNRKRKRVIKAYKGNYPLDIEMIVFGQLEFSVEERSVQRSFERDEPRSFQVPTNWVIVQPSARTLVE